MIVIALLINAKRQWMVCPLARNSVALPQVPLND